MSLRYPINFRHSVKFNSKALKKRRKDFENKIKKLVTNSMVINNRELTERNVTLLAEIQELKNEKLQLFERFMFNRQNTNQTIPKSDLMVLLETIRSLDKDMVEMFEKTHNFYNQMINKISDKIEELVENENNSETTLNNVTLIAPEVGSAVGSTVDKPSKSQQIYEMKRNSRQNCSPDSDTNVENSSLSVIRETTQEVSLKNDNISIETAGSVTTNSVEEYELSSDFTQNFQTPSIYNFKSISRRTLNQDLTFGTPMPLLDISERPDISFQSYDSFNTTITGTENMITSSTPINQKRMSEMEAIRRPSSRVSSINPYFSPRLQRPSLMEIQNVIENKAKKEEPNAKRKKGRKPTTKRKFKTKTETNDSIDCQTNDENMDTTKKKSKTLDTTTVDTDMSDVSLNCSLSLRSRRQNKKQISYKQFL